MNGLPEYDELPARVERVLAAMPNSEEALACFLAIAKAIAGPTDYELVLENFADGLRTLIPHDHLDIVLLHPSGTQICYEARLHTTWSHAHNPAKPTETSPIRAVLRGELPYILTDDAWEDDRFHFEGADSKPLFDANLRSRIIVPMRVQGEIIGSLAISSHKVNYYDADLAGLTQGAADLVSAYLFALERGKEARDAAVAESEAKGREKALRMGALQLTEGMERERQRLGMDLHDQTLADLARIKRRMSRLEADKQLSTQELALLQDDLDHCLADVRHIVEAMKPGVLQLFGFSEAVDAHLERCMKHSRRSLVWDVEDRTGGKVDKLPETVRTAVYRIVQEAVNNALKHADCAKISVTVSTREKSIDVCVDDDGNGISEDAVKSASGINNIRTRAELISATVNFENRHDDAGTRVTISVPYAAAS
ncbi:histidine kinase [Shimia isoporae]|uniref:histidine kinase n=1 Tax=Shimia isoporae TaxID=647720 RepID=A0A4R1N0I7_9RHOB|nr:ATP-binding protein [Shimia isoporae]TCK99305.1 histidine kinase [Shimia isoporae]